VTDERIYVFMDFEGLISSERSDQEDMLMAVFGASVSSAILFKTTSQFDRYTEEMLSRFSEGAAKTTMWDPKRRQLFRGAFFFVLKDVNPRDAEAVRREFRQKLGIKVNKQGNFMRNLYGENHRLHTPTFCSPSDSKFYKNIEKLSKMIKKIDPVFSSGAEFLQMTKLLLAKLSILDFNSVDNDRFRLLVNSLQSKAATALRSGCEVSPSGSEEGNVLPLYNRHTDEFITDPDIAFQVSLTDKDVQILQSKNLEKQNEWVEVEQCDSSFYGVIIHGFDDTGLIMMADNGDDAPIQSSFNDTVKRFDSLIQTCRHDNHHFWHKNLESYIKALVARRSKRVNEWLSVNTDKFKDCEAYALLQPLTEHINRNLIQIGKLWKLCSHPTCANCNYTCNQLCHTSSIDHNCLMDHKCKELCDYCSKTNPGATVKCSLPSGHQSHHCCDDVDHVCNKPCILSYAMGCQKTCNKEPFHVHSKVKDEAICRCASDSHFCSKSCDLKDCSGLCVEPVDLLHERHKCSMSTCPEMCMLCNNTCKSKDHFHAVTSKEHLCGVEHTCKNPCSHPGNCLVSTSREKKKETYQGLRANVTYEIEVIESAVRLKCCKRIPPDKLKHEGVCVHSVSQTVFHSCTSRCPQCLYFCTLEVNHEEPLHVTQHGNIRNGKFCAQSSGEQDLDLDLEESRLYRAGDRAIAEMCDQCCKRMGRGHFHVIECSNDCRSRHAVKDGWRHHGEYTTDANEKPIIMDELYHESYCRYIGWEDWCKDFDKEKASTFNKCCFICPDQSHNKDSAKDNTEPGSNSRSYCYLPLWHEELEPGKSLQPDFASKYNLPMPESYFISHNGHLFVCKHPYAKQSTFFLLDQSGSMDWEGVLPTEAFIKNSEGLNNRLGAVYDAFYTYLSQRQITNPTDDVTVIMFESTARTVIDCESINPNIVNKLLKYKPGGGTSFCGAFEQAVSCLERSRLRDMFNMPSFIILTDGLCHDNTQTYLKSVMETEAATFPDCTCWSNRSSCRSNNGHRLTVHGVTFGASDGAFERLKNICRTAHGTCTKSIENISELTKVFMQIVAEPDKKGKSSVAVVVDFQEEKE